MYTSKTSAKLTRVITWIFAALLLLLMIFADALLKWFFPPIRQKKSGQPRLTGINAFYYRQKTEKTTGQFLFFCVRTFAIIVFVSFL